MRVLSAISHDIKLQFKHGFYYAYLLISAVYIVELSSFQLPAAAVLHFYVPFSFLHFQGAWRINQSHPAVNDESYAVSPEFLNLIKEHPVETIHSQEASLEDIFIDVTGRRLS